MMMICTSKAFIILSLFFSALFLIPSSMAELEKSNLVRKAGPELKDEGESRGLTYTGVKDNTPIAYRALDPTKPVPTNPAPGRPYNRGCRSAYYCYEIPPQHPVVP